jgi:hypothetical protein
MPRPTVCPVPRRAYRSRSNATVGIGERKGSRSNLRTTPEPHCYEISGPHADASHFAIKLADTADAYRFQLSR